MSIKQIELAGPMHAPQIVADEYDGVLLPDVKFPTAFSLGSLEQGKTFKIKYLTERWHWFNQHSFGGAMKLPNEFEITKNFKDIKLFGSWTPGKRLLKMHPKLWLLKSESQCLGTLLHEMAHQYVDEHIPDARREDPHGPTWKSVMTKIGLSPAAKWNGRHEDLRSIQEHRVVDRFRTTAPKVLLEQFVQPYNLAVYVNTVKGRKTPLVVIGSYLREKSEGWRDTFVPAFSAKDATGDSFRWYELQFLYTPDKPEVDADFPKILLGNRAKEKAQQIFELLQARKRQNNAV